MIRINLYPDLIKKRRAHATYMRSYYRSSVERRDRANLQSSRRRQAHLEETRAVSRNYAAEHVAEAVERVRQWRIKNRKAHLESKSRYTKRLRERDPERLRVRFAKWFETRPGYSSRRRALKKSGVVTATEWNETREVHDSRCAYCLRQFAKLEQEHVTALSRGGEHQIDNIVPACRPCNSRKGNRGILSMLRFAA